MKKCPMCGQLTENNQSICPNCGSQFISPKDAKKAITAIDEIMGYLNSSLDISPLGMKAPINLRKVVCDEILRWSRMCTHSVPHTALPPLSDLTILPCPAILAA
jgi:hypothetical protein